jgi:hypothetical protein
MAGGAAQQPPQGDVPGDAADLGVTGVLRFEQQAREFRGVVSRAADLRLACCVGRESRAELTSERGR